MLGVLELKSMDGHAKDEKLMNKKRA